MTKAIKPAAPNAGISSQLTIGHHWPGVGEPGRSTMESTGMPAPLGSPSPSLDRGGSSGQPATGRPTSRDWIGMRRLDPGAAKRRRRRIIGAFCHLCASLRPSRSLFLEPAKRWLYTRLPGGRSAVREYTADNHEEGITLSKHSGEANRRPAAPPGVGSPFGSPSCARASLPAAIAHLGRSAARRALP
jgi:hypothetical protein